MDNRKRLGVVALATAAGVVFAQGASAGIIVDTMDGTAFSPRDTASSNAPTAEITALVQGFSITSASTLNTAAIRGYSQGADVTISIASMIGPGSTELNVLFEQTFAVTPDGFGTSIRSFALGGLELSAGDYFFVVMSDDPQGFEWAKVGSGDSIGINDRGASTFLAGSSWYSQEYDFETADNAQVFTLEIDGVSGIPAPGAAAMLAGFGVLATRRKRC